MFLPGLYTFWEDHFSKQHVQMFLGTQEVRSSQVNGFQKVPLDVQATHCVEGL